MAIRAVIHPTPISPPLPLPLPLQIQSKARDNVSTRRVALGGLLLLSLSAPSLSFASSASAFGISGPKEWLKEQNKKTSKFLLAPIEASRFSLNKAYQLLTSENVPVKLEEISGLINSATRDCAPDQRNSIVTFQSRTGVEVCTFSLILKNASSLLDKKDPIKLEAEDSLKTLVRSLSNIGSVIETSNFELPSDRKKMEDGLTDTLSALEKFEEGVKSCLGI